MADPVPIHESLETIVGLLTEMRDANATQSAIANDLLDTIASILSSTRGFTASIDETTDNIYALLGDLAGTVELINNNGSVNAQNGQAIALSGIGVCCDDTTPATGTVDDQCAIAQEMIAKLLDILSAVGLDAEAGGMPTLDQLVNAFTVSEVGGTVSLLSQADAGRLLAALYDIGLGGMGDVGGVNDDPALKDVLLNIFGNSTSAQTSALGVRQMDSDVYDEPSKVIEAVKVLFSSISVVNHLWDSPALWSGSGYDNGICGEEPPVEGTGWFNAGDCTDTGIGPGNIVGTFEMTGGGSGSLSPNGFAAHGLGPMYCRICANTTTQADKTVKLWTMSGSTKVDLIGTGVPDDVFTFTFPSEDSWGIEMVDPGDPLLDTMCIYLVFGWSSADTEHCPE